MIITLPETDTRTISRRLVSMREQLGIMTTGRVLTLIVLTDEVRGSEAAIAAASNASREHPSRVLVVIRGDRASTDRLDAELRLGGEVGAAEIVVLRTAGALVNQSAAILTPLLLPDTPAAVWWPRNSPRNLADDKVGRLANRRIVDSDAEGHPSDALARRVVGYSPGDTDLAWARITHWRALLASTLDQPPYEEILSATVSGPEKAASVDLAGGWLASRLGIDVDRASGRQMVVLHRPSSSVVLEQLDRATIEVRVGSTSTARVAMTPRDVSNCLAEELRSLDADEIYAEALRGLDRVINTSVSVR